MLQFRILRLQSSAKLLNFEPKKRDVPVNRHRRRRHRKYYPRNKKPRSAAFRRPVKLLKLQPCPWKSPKPTHPCRGVSAVALRGATSLATRTALGYQTDAEGRHSTRRD